ncbi:MULTISPECIES: PTS glucitol/sorbitol transporter subunit IIA [unclassified Rhizobium]|uniref:PTS glucitol/sorbitol transporter subunit IIA n=1 Tax=unclassified Rhizobium TaxID=2613769 RepID=UPI001ADCB4D5|nr:MULTISPECIES: PTS glucitol/sorbitol transporter subunit IIA [unclassified Rhizobium]MBO9100611.1 PTS cellobiose transporter subunit IIB [Rhizobium sp. L58/93]MBO9136027.1 PTS cellobiose transporter subunit IIB [Rhizobium sp. B209b/85]MBO9171338.1 PTS cellobiose transporter subunit IIB [Rhizobium sp. L245/93]MBO9187205.1 PTS cellobiose transporter subunit IIB [Rhizobium sp. E27B/91]QXZ87891.1 PTS cellobiose transporter subunit IIB [Rhizobium sp. K1/93]
MALHLKTQITAVGPDVADLADGGVLILFADGAPPELAEVSVLHLPDVGPTEQEPSVGSSIRVGSASSRITAMGPIAWNKVLEIGHVVINFNDATTVDSPGAICAAAIDADVLKSALSVGTTITIGD